MKLKNKNSVWMFVLLLTVSVLGLAMSCTMGIGDIKPYLYNRKVLGSYEDDIVEIEIEEESETELDENDPFYKEPYAKLDYSFDGSKIGDFIFKVSFDDQNVPSYSFVKKGADAWQLQDAKTNKYYYNGTGDGNKAQTYNIAPANIYRYNGYNPLTGRKGGRMERFQFYALLNSKAVVADLNQYLIAVDTYSKFVFAYGKITKTKSIVGQELPVKFEAVEKHGSKIAFYQYDPIGAVKLSDDGNTLHINLYDEYKNEMRQSAVNFFPKIHNTSRAIATYNTPGLSPYYFVEDLSSLPPFLQKVAGKTFAKRDKTSYEYVSNGTRVHVNENDAKLGFAVTHDDWEFSSNGKTLMHIRKDDLQGKTLTEVSYAYESEESNGTTATYKAENGTTITLKLDEAKNDLSKDNVVVGNSEFKDPGADFILRVKGRKYIKVVGNMGSRKTVVYEFSEDGGTVKTQNMTGQSIGDWASGSGTYHFVQERDGDKTQAVYQFVGGKIKAPLYLLGITCYSEPFYGLNLLDDGYKQIQRTRASSNKDPWKEDEGTLAGFTTTVRDYFSGDCEIGVLSRDNISPDDLVLDDFLMFVQNVRFRARETVEYSYKTKLTSTNKQEVTKTVKGNGFNLFDWQFSDDGKTITQKALKYGESLWKEFAVYKVDEGQKLTSANEAKYTCVGDNKTYTFKYDENNASLYKNNEFVGEGIIDEYGYKDFGPDFILRVRGAAFVNGNVSFVFSEDGGSVKATNMQGISQGGAFSGDGTYYFKKERGEDDIGNAKATAVYQFTGGNVTLIGNDPVYALMLSESDNAIVRSTGIENSKDPPWLGTGSATCYRVSMLGREFAFRPTTKYNYKDENNKENKILERTGNGLDLEKYKFSDDGKTMTLTKTNWRTGKVTTEATYTYIDSEPITKGMLRGKYQDNKGGQYTLSYDVTNGTLKFGGTVKAYANYKDPGPDFILRVKNTTYQGSGYTYTIGEYGVITDQTGKKYYFAATRDGHPSTTAVYWEGGLILKYRGLKISDDGKKLWWTPTAWASVGTTDPTTLASSFEANRTSIR